MTWKGTGLHPPAVISQASVSNRKKKRTPKVEGDTVAAMLWARAAVEKKRVGDSEGGKAGTEVCLLCHKSSGGTVPLGQRELDLDEAL